MNLSNIKAIAMMLVMCLSIIESAKALESSDLNNPKVMAAFMDGLVEPLMKNHNSPSGTISIIKGGKIIFSKGYGYQNIAKKISVDPGGTLFRPGSVSKLFTWVSVMQMVEQGKLDLDVDINKYLKTFQIKDTFPGQPVTMRHIMTHTAGFEDGGIGYLIIDDPARIMPLAESMKRYQVERVNSPGKQTAYSNYATAVAGLIVANLSGMDFSDYVQKNIFDALGMRSSSFKEPLPDNLGKNMAVGYAFEGGKYVEKPFEIISNFAPAGALSATSTDMIIFAQAILNGGEYKGGRILQQETVRQMLTRNFTHDDRMMGMDLGFYETRENGFRLVGHGGTTGFFHSELVIDQKNDLAYFLSFSGQDGAVIHQAFKKTFYDIFYPKEARKITPPSDFSARAGKYGGNYLFWRSGFSGLEKVMKLMSGIPVFPTDENTLMVLFGGKASQYAEIDKNLFQDINGENKLAFQENDKEEITGFVMEGLPFMSTFKASFYYSAGFNFFFLGFSMLVFFGVMLRLFYQWDRYKALSGAQKEATRAAVIVAGVNLVTLIFGGIVIAAVGGQLFTIIPLPFKIWLFFPIMATLAGIYGLYHMVLVWKDGLCGGRGARIRYSIVMLCALFMGWLYYFWNILGFQYLA